MQQSSEHILGTFGNVGVCQPAVALPPSRALPRDAHWIGHKGFGTAVHMHIAVACCQHAIRKSQLFLRKVLPTCNCMVYILAVANHVATSAVNGLQAQAGQWW